MVNNLDFAPGNELFIIQLDFSILKMAMQLKVKALNVDPKK